MPSSIPLLYGTTVLIWGSSWLAITFQLGSVAPSWSVAWRFLLAAAILFAIRALRERRPLPGIRLQAGMALQGALLFSVNYYLFYLAIGFIPSGLTAVVFSLIQVMNTVFAALFFGYPIRARVVVGGLVGITGLSLIFLPALTDTAFDAGTVIGLLLSLAATASASLGNMAAMANQRRGLSVTESNTFGMAYGAALTTVFALAHFVILNGPAPSFDFSPAYVLSLLHLTLLASIVGFWAYLTLLNRIGPDRAAYATILFPVVALGLSTAFEGYQWTLSAATGVVLVLAGNLIVMTRIATPRLAEKTP